MDIRCSNHMTGHREWFTSLDEKVKSKIKFIDNSKVMIKRRDDHQSFISDVLYVPSMKNNLLSLGQLLEKGYSMNMEHSQLKVFDIKGRLIVKAHLSKNRNFKIRIQIMEHHCLATDFNDESWVWHHRFGHLNFRSLNLQ